MPSRSPQDAAFDAFYETARHNAVLSPRTTLLLHLAAALSAGCEP